MRLTRDEEGMLRGDKGPAPRKAMKIVVALGEIYGAAELVPVTSVQVAGVSYGNLGEAGLEFLREWAEQGARAVVPATLNPAGMDLEAWRQLGIPEEYAESQLAVVEAYRSMGITASCSCTPYLVGNRPVFGEHIAWSESSAVSYANSVLGARTNREGGPSALAAAIAGRTAKYGFHLEQVRQAGLVVEVTCALHSLADFGALGWRVGQRADAAVPYFRLNSVPKPGLEELKALGAAMAASGNVALYHIEGVTPEAQQRDVVAADAPTITVDSLDNAYRALNGSAHEINLVWIGCPHASLAEIEKTADEIDGRELTARLWVTTAREVLNRARSKGLTDRIGACGGHVVADACLIGAPLSEMGISSVATNSSKGAFYLRSHKGLSIRFGALSQCIEAAITGKWAP